MILSPLRCRVPQLWYLFHSTFHILDILKANWPCLPPQDFYAENGALKPTSKSALMLITHAEPRRPSSRKLQEAFHRPPARLLPAISWDFAVMVFLCSKNGISSLRNKSVFLQCCTFVQSTQLYLPSEYCPSFGLNPGKWQRGVLDHNHILVG